MKKRILIVTFDYYPHEGGKSTHMKYLIQGLTEQGVECDVLSRNCVGKFSSFFNKLFIQFYKIFGIDAYLYHRLKTEKKLFKRVLFKKLKNGYDMISFQDAISCSLLKQCNLKTPNVSLTMHTYFGLEYSLDNDSLKLDNKYYKMLLNEELESLNNVKSIISVDNSIERHVKDVLESKQIKSIKVYCIKNFINTSMFPDLSSSILNGDINTICVRRLVEKNGVIFAVRAFKMLDERFKLHIVGDGPEYIKIKEFIDSNNLSNRIILYGSVKNDDVLSIYKKCNCAIVPSITVNGLQEATSISALEAMACGLPIVVSQIGGLAELVEDKLNGFLVKEKDCEGITNIFNFIDNNRLSASSIGKKAREYVLERHSHTNAANLYLKIFSSK